MSLIGIKSVRGFRGFKGSNALNDSDSHFSEPESVDGRRTTLPFSLGYLF